MQIIHIKYVADLRQLKSTMLFISCITGITINYNLMFLIAIYSPLNLYNVHHILL
jgi:hypothetical protein